MSSQTTETITCTMCGHNYDPTGLATCQGCPLQKGCQLACCPVCGYENVDISRSSLVRLTNWFIGRSKSENPTQVKPTPNQEEET